MPKTVIAFGDLHFPFHDSSTLKKSLIIAAQIYKREPANTAIVQLGDVFDMFSHSKFPRQTNLMTPRQEIERARENADDFWAAIVKSCPKAECYQLTGNHDVRPYKRLIERYPDAECFVSFKEWFEFKGVTTIHDARDYLEIDGVYYMHGFLSGLGKHMQYFQNSVVCGHTHHGGVVFQKKKDKLLFELNAGYLASDKATALSYTPTKFSKWTLGLGIVDELGPRFIPI